MAIHDELKPDAEQLPYLLASNALRVAHGLETRSAGYTGILDETGSETVIGAEQTGDTITQWVGDTTAPGRPLGISATSDMQCVLVRWDGTLDGGLPADFRCVTVYAMRMDTETDYDSEEQETVDDSPTSITLGDLTAAGEVASGVLTVGDTYDIWAIAYDNAHDRYGNPAYNASVESAHVQVTITPLVSQEELDKAADRILDTASEGISQQIKRVDADINNANKAIESNRESLEQEAYLRAEGDKAAQSAAADVKAQTDKLTEDYKGMSTDVASVKSDLKNVMTTTSALETSMIVSSTVEYTVGTGATVPTTGWSTSTPSVSGEQRAWMRTKVTYGDGTQEYSSPVLVTGAPGATGATGATGPQGAAGAKGEAGAQGVGVSGIVPFWQLSETKPAQPTQKSPGGGWTGAEPAFEQGKKLWTCSRIDYSNGQWSWTSVQQSSSYDLAALALTTADGKNRRFVQPDTPDAQNLTQGDEWWQTSSKPLETAWTGEPNNSVSVLVDHSDEVEHIWVWNGTRWALNRLSAEDIFVAGSVAASLVSADFFDGAVVKGGAFLTSNERIQLNNNGMVMLDKGGVPLVTLDAVNGTATFTDVHIIGSGITSPTVQGGEITGADFKIVDGDGRQVARLNSDGISFGDSLTYSKRNGQWVLSLKGPVQSGGDMSGVTITAPVLQTTAEAKKGLKLTDGGLVAYNTNGDVTFTLDADGTILMDGGVIANGEVRAAKITGGDMTGTTLQTMSDANRGVKIIGKQLKVYNDDGHLMLALDGADGTALLTGGVRTSYTGSRVELRNDTYTVPTGGTAIQGSITGYDDVGEVWHLTGSSNRGAAVGSPQLSLHMGISPQQPELMIQRYSDGTQLSIVAGRVDIASTVATVGGKQSGIYVNGMRLDPVVVPASDFITFANGYGEYGGGHNISRCYCLQIGKLLLFQLEVSGSIPSSSSYTRVGTLKNGYIPLRAVNAPAVYSGGGMGGAFIIGQTADGNLAPGGVYFGQTTGSTRNWGAATLLAYR